MMASINIKTATKVVPQCYAYTTPGIPSHEGWTKIGFTERDVETRINEQTHTVGVHPKIWWHMRAAYMTEPYGTFTDKEFHSYLKKLQIPRRMAQNGLKSIQIRQELISLILLKTMVQFLEDRLMLSFHINCVMSKMRQ